MSNFASQTNLREGHRKTTGPNQQALLQRKCACGQHTAAGGECTECRKKRMSLQRRAAGQAEPTSVPPIVHEVLRSPGRPLDAATRGFMEPRFGHDFSRVRVHTDAKAAESARAVNALAYTVGPHLVFGEGQYAPQMAAGRQLLAHELVHVVQQSGVSGWRADLTTSEPEDARERVAQAFAEHGPNAATKQLRTTAKGSTTLCLQRHTDPDLFIKGENFHPLSPKTRQEVTPKRKCIVNKVIAPPRDNQGVGHSSLVGSHPSAHRAVGKGSHLRSGYTGRWSPVWGHTGWSVQPEASWQSSWIRGRGRAVVAVGLNSPSYAEGASVPRTYGPPKAPATWIGAA